MPVALAVSPHLDDAAFSCGGLLARLADSGWSVCMATVFTRSVPDPKGFALNCQLDKGLGPEVDYMALRRAEDREAGALLGVSDLRWGDLPEAPHRGYGSAPELFGDIRNGDEVWWEVRDLVSSLVGEFRPSLVLAPQGLGNHVDHRQVIRAVLAASVGVPLAFFRDTPYAIRHPGALRNVTVPEAVDSVVPIGGSPLERKVAASCAYRSQVGFQFGGAAAAAAALREFAAREGQGVAAERFVGALPELAPLPSDG